MPEPKCIAFPQVKRCLAIAIVRPQLQLCAVYVKKARTMPESFPGRSLENPWGSTGSLERRGWGCGRNQTREVKFLTSPRENTGFACTGGWMSHICTEGEKGETTHKTHSQGVFAFSSV